MDTTEYEAYLLGSLNKFGEITESIFMYRFTGNLSG